MLNVSCSIVMSEIYSFLLLWFVLIGLGYFYCRNWYSFLREAGNRNFVGCHRWLPVSTQLLFVYWVVGRQGVDGVSLFLGGIVLWSKCLIKVFCFSIGSRLCFFLVGRLSGRQVQNSFVGLICSAALNYFVNESIGVRVGVGNKIDSQMFMLPFEAEGSKHCC